MTGHLVPLLFLAPLLLQNAAESHPPEPGRLWSGWRGKRGWGAMGRGHSSLVEAEETLELKVFFPAAFCQGPHILEDEGLLEPPFIDTEKHFVWNTSSLYISDGILWGGPLFLF